jgi:hypothetical protein
VCWEKGWSLEFLWISWKVHGTPCFRKFWHLHGTTRHATLARGGFPSQLTMCHVLVTYLAVTSSRYHGHATNSCTCDTMVTPDVQSSLIAVFIQCAWWAVSFLGCPPSYYPQSTHHDKSVHHPIISIIMCNVCIAPCRTCSTAFLIVNFRCYRKWRMWPILTKQISVSTVSKLQGTTRS